MNADERAHVRELCRVAVGIGPNIVTKALDALDAAESLRPRDPHRTGHRCACCGREGAPEADALCPWCSEGRAAERERDDARAQHATVLASLAHALAQGDALRAEAKDLHDRMTDAEVRATRADATLDNAGRRIVNLYAERNAARAERDDARAEVETLRAEAALLRSIIEGRTTPPTDAEIAAHEARGGTWRVVALSAYGKPPLPSWDFVAGGFVQEVMGEDSVGDYRCWPLDADGRPCAWPTVTP
jgi:hypothetical protein